VRSASEAYFDQELEEAWGGLTVSRAVSDSISVGLTGYGVYRGQRVRKELSLEAVAGPRALIASGVSDFEYSHYRALAKVGVAWQSRSWKAGLSITTPSLGAFGSGQAAYTLSLAGVDANEDGVTDDPILASGTAEDLDSHYHSSWAVGAGASRLLRATRIYASLEWFAPVGRFTVIELPDDTTGSGRLAQELGSVLNAGLGIEHVVSDDVSVYGAFHTDFSAFAGGAEANVAISDWDIYHLSGGVSFRIHDNRFTLGASWATGGTTRALDSPIPPEAFPGAQLGSEAKIQYSKLTFLLGFVFGR
jgi:hypothetical protein